MAGGSDEAGWHESSLKCRSQEASMVIVQARTKVEEGRGQGRD